MRVGWWHQLALANEGGLTIREWRFVESIDWEPPPEFAHLIWFVIDPDSDEVVMHEDKPVPEKVVYAYFRERLVPFDTGRERDGVKWPCVAWYSDGKPFYVADVSYDAVKRPVLICIAGIR